MSFDVDIGYASRRGPRELNEDFGGVARAAAHEASRGLVAAVADGVSGGGLGLEASQTTVMGLLADVFAVPETWESTVVLDRLIGAQNAWLADHNRRRSGVGAALTTLTTLAVRGQTWTLAHVGDTRAWLLRDAGQGVELSLLTQDHTVDHPDLRNRLTRAVGLDDRVRVDHAQGEVRVGDTFVLTTDGVHGPLKARRLAELAGEGSAQQASDALVQAALDGGGQDNATALVVRIRGLDTRGLHDELARVKHLPVPPLLKAGDLLDGHGVTALIADTGVHRVYQAHEPTRGARVAIKTLHPSRAGDAQEREMLAHEAWLGLRLGEGEGARGFVRVHPRTADPSALYTVFDWHDGRTVQQALDAGERPSVAEAVEALTEWARALGRLHRQGCVHRDIKPGNLHRGDDGQWRIFDLGVALSGRESEAQRELHAGTPSYMNPEQWAQDGRADAGSDLFALGVTGYQWLTGRLPYGEIEPWPVARHRRDPPPASRLRPDVPIWLDRLLAKAIAREAAQRFETAEELLLALERGAARPLDNRATPLMRRDPAVLWRAAFLASSLLNVLLVVWLLFLPR